MISNGSPRRRFVHVAQRIGLLLVAVALSSVFMSALAANENGPAAATGRIPFPKPKSHSANWIEYHGKAVEPTMNGGLLSNNCLICHEKTDCIACHNTRMPRDHTNTWRTLSHGFMAEGNRERCLICHRQDFCVRCHSETAPRSHVGNWTVRHCTWCHFGSGLAPADNCIVCHKLAPHTSAPHPVNPGMNCGLCHK
ncbi:MAG: hypothetical protein ACM3MD_12410 [Betaproteobacteria bacterium]